MDVHDIVYKKRKSELIKAINSMPVYYEALKVMNIGDSIVNKVAKNFILSKTSYMGRGHTMKFSYASEEISAEIDSFRQSYISKCRWANKDFRDFLSSLSFRSKEEERRTFVYCDPPYVMEKGGLEKNKEFNVEDMKDLLKLLKAREWKYSISCRQKSASFWKDNGLFVDSIGKINVGFKSKLNEHEYLAMNYRIHPELF